MSVPRRVGALLVVAVLAVASCGQAPRDGASTVERSVRVPPVDGGFDYQLGGSYDTKDVSVVVRDESAQPLAGVYNVCYVNGFQTQPGDGENWLQHRDTAVLRDGHAAAVVDPDWPDEYVLDPSTPAQRQVILDAVGPLIASCADKGFDAVELDNFDTFTRFRDAAAGHIEEQGAFELARSYTSLAHAEGLAIGQKNAAEAADRGRHEVGFDFAVAEECAAFSECGLYRRAYGPHVLQIEYTDNLPQPFDAVCASPDRAPQLVLRDRDLVARGAAGYAYEQCR